MKVWVFKGKQSKCFWKMEISEWNPDLSFKSPHLSQRSWVWWVFCVAPAGCLGWTIRDGRQEQCGKWPRTDRSETTMQMLDLWVQCVQRCTRREGWRRGTRSSPPVELYYTVRSGWKEATDLRIWAGMGLSVAQIQTQSFLWSLLFLTYHMHTALPVSTTFLSI